MIPVAFAAALVGCRKPPKTGPGEIAVPRPFSGIFGFKVKKVKPQIQTVVKMEKCPEPIRVLPPGMTEGPKPAMQSDPLSKYNKLSFKVDLFLDSNARSLKKKHKYKELKRAHSRYEKKKNKENGEALLKAYDEARKALDSRPIWRGNGGMRPGARPKNGMKPENGMPAGMGTMQGGMTIKI